MKNLLTNQLSFKFSAVISAEIFSTSDFLAIRVILTKSALMILHHFFYKAVKTAFKNINLSNSAISNLISQTVRATSNSNSQTVRIASSVYKLYDWSWKNEVVSII